jgi:hypothetical protein
MDYDNIRDSQAYGYNAGVIIEGKVTLDEVTKEFIILDDENKAFSSQEFLKSHFGKIVRFTCIDIESAENIERMLKQNNVSS